MSSTDSDEIRKVVGMPLERVVGMAGTSGRHPSESMVGMSRNMHIDGDGDIDIVFGQEEGTGGNEIYFNE